MNEYYCEMSEIAEELGHDVGVISLPFAPAIYGITTPETFEFVMKTKFEYFEKGKFVDERVQDLLGNGIFNSDGERWSVQRKIFSKIFTVSAFKDYCTTTFRSKTMTLKSILEQKAVTGEIVDVDKLFYKLTVDSFCQIAYGVDFNSLEKDIPFSDDFNAAQVIIARRFISPFWKIEDYFNLNHFRMRGYVKTIRGFAGEVVDQRTAEIKDGQGHNGTDLLSFFMEYTREDGTKFGREDTIDMIINFIRGGRDATGQALSWYLYELNRNPRVLKKLREEIDAVFGSSEFPTYDQVKSMKYALAIFYETLRCWPGLVRNAKTATRNVKLPNGIIIPKGDTVLWSSLAFGRSKKIWGSNARVFLPERWLDRERLPSQFEYPVFNAGPRICPGKTLSEVEVIFVIVSLLHKFDIEIQNIEHVQPARSLSLPIANGMYCKISLRKQASG